MNSNPTNPAKNPAPANNKPTNGKPIETEKMDKNDRMFWTVIAAIVIVAAIIIFGVHRFANAPSTSGNGANGTTADAATTTADALTVVASAATSTPSYTYSCDRDKSITATFHLPQDDFVNVNLSDGRHFILAHAVSADGARYTNVNEKIVFWNKGDTAFLTENGTSTYSNCVANRFP